jgi:hypothetical protein
MRREYNPVVQTSIERLMFVHGVKGISFHASTLYGMLDFRSETCMVEFIQSIATNSNGIQCGTTKL